MDLDKKIPNSKSIQSGKASISWETTSGGVTMAAITNAKTMK